MVVVVGHFRFRPLRQDEQQTLAAGLRRDLATLAAACPGFRGVYFARPREDEVVTTWLWDSAAAWEACAGYLRHPESVSGTRSLRLPEIRSGSQR